MDLRLQLARPLVTMLLLGLGSAPAVFAQSAAADFAAASKRVEADVAAASAAWEEQNRLYADLSTAAQALEAGLANADATANVLRALEDRYAVALEAAVRQARLTSDSRRRVYDGMDQLAALGRRVQQEKRAAYDVPMPGGLWSLQVGDSDLVGLLRLTAQGTLVSGDYRLSNGRHGSVSGTYVSGRLELVRVDSQSGRDLSMVADVDTGRGSLSGSWQRTELASGGPSMGTWTAVRLGPGDEVPDLDAK